MNKSMIKRKKCMALKATGATFGFGSFFAGVGVISFTKCNVDSVWGLMIFGILIGFVLFCHGEEGDEG